MKSVLLCLVLCLTSLVPAFSQDEKVDKAPNTIQFYSGKFGYYHPGDGLNNGLLFGIDGITEFTHYNFFLSGAIDVYPKQTIDIFEDPQPGGGAPPNVTQQQMILLPLHLNAAYKLFEVTDADTRGYIGLGGGYYFYFYSVTYQTSGGLLGGGLTSSNESRNGGAVFGSVFSRVVINKIFVEPRVYFASKKEDDVGGYKFIVNPSGYAITLGFQYH
ncbi:MAG TPA: hypothetical protein VL633_13960 [Bacteroidota bacterium]|jgi:hypothetical protein|nr:hypothetical protein [Bacteroidota bacterium]